MIFRRQRVTGKAIVTFALLGLVAIPAHALFATMVDISFSEPGGADLVGLAVARLQLNTLTYAAFGLVAGAAALHRVATEKARALGEISATLEQAQKRAASSETATLPVTIGPKRSFVPLHDVEWFGSASNYVVVNWAGREALMRRTLQSLERELDPLLFARSHRGTIVNLGKVATAEPLSDGSWRLLMNSGAEVVVSRTYRDDILLRLRRTETRP
jgi:DNA-binding LytR/AlgR family response regulator